MADKYIIRVTAGSDYDLDRHIVVPVNSHEPIKISSDLIDAELNVRVQNYHGLPRNSPNTSPYFSQEPHATNKDQYSIAIRFTPKKPATNTKSKVSSTEPSRSSSTSRSSQDPLSSGSSSTEPTEESSDEESASGISGEDLQFGNDFDHPIRDRLPPGFSYAMNIVKWWIDPGLEGDAYADQPYLYGSALSSFNAIHVGPGEVNPEKGGLWFEEGGDEDGLKGRQDVGAPGTAKDRMKWALKPFNKSRWVFQYGNTYCLDFFNPYLDFNEFSLRLPGFTLPIMKYWDGQSLRSSPKRSHTLRYVLRNRSTDQSYLVIVFTLYLKEDVNEDGSLKPAAIEATNKGKAMTEESVNVVEEAGEVCKDEDYRESRKQFEKLDVNERIRKPAAQDDAVD
ncbi:DUF1769-domain-containing protein [Annulohypoxylon maeteangense]|uniref:DUF1769-domain-containing protein n=1 Tax=Annulohypoxylon maeteangense TaxID=1927788 RepID=UPI002007E970|nr:DUF1769-domain-containing protein [Annulohypoxylon maeteangense]KAI0882351.1 DUF1769-domain-containing protein [Annulohypoxylon maeteangense]